MEKFSDFCNCLNLLDLFLQHPKPNKSIFRFRPPPFFPKKESAKYPSPVPLHFMSVFLTCAI